jgi:mono/diheme cytochrome c family protein
LLVSGSSPTIQAAGQFALYAAPVTFALVLLLTIIRPAFNNKLIALLSLAAAFILLGSFEWTREAARRPYVLNQVMYSHGISVAQAEAMQGKAFLDRAKWSTVDKATEQNLLQAGEELFKLQCYACHTIGGINNDILPKTAAMNFPAMHGYLRNVIHKRPYMPPFLGDELEATALAAYLVGGLHGKEVDVNALASSADRGQQIYSDHCVGCHGIDIVKAWATGQSLAEIETGLQSLSGLNDMMPDFAGTAGERRLLAGYLQHQVKPGGLDGQTAFAENCTGCHGADAFLNWANEKSLHAIIDGLADLGHLNPMMQGLSLSEPQRTALANWALVENRGDK